MWSWRSGPYTRRLGSTSPKARVDALVAGLGQPAKRVEVLYGSFCLSLGGSTQLNQGPFYWAQEL